MRIGGLCVAVTTRIPEYTVEWETENSTGPRDGSVDISKRMYINIMLLGAILT